MSSSSLYNVVYSLEFHRMCQDLLQSVTGKWVQVNKPESSPNMPPLDEDFFLQIRTTEVQGVPEQWSHINLMKTNYPSRFTTVAEIRQRQYFGAWPLSECEIEQLIINVNVFVTYSDLAALHSICLNSTFPEESQIEIKDRH